MDKKIYKKGEKFEKSFPLESIDFFFFLCYTEKNSIGNTVFFWEKNLIGKREIVFTSYPAVAATVRTFLFSFTVEKMGRKGACMR